MKPKPVYFTIEAVRRNAERERRETRQMLWIIVLFVTVVAAVICFHLR